MNQKILAAAALCCLALTACGKKDEVPEKSAENTPAGTTAAAEISAETTAAAVRTEPAYDITFDQPWQESYAEQLFATDVDEIAGQLGCLPADVRFTTLNLDANGIPQLVVYAYNDVAESGTYLLYKIDEFGMVNICGALESQGEYACCLPGKGAFAVHDANGKYVLSVLENDSFTSTLGMTPEQLQTLAGTLGIVQDADGNGYFSALGSDWKKLGPLNGFPLTDENIYAALS